MLASRGQITCTLLLAVQAPCYCSITTIFLRAKLLDVQVFLLMLSYNTHIYTNVDCSFENLLWLNSTLQDKYKKYLAS